MSDAKKKVDASPETPSRPDDDWAADLAAELLDSTDGSGGPEQEGEPGSGGEVAAASSPERAGTLRRLFRSRLASLEVDARVVRAREADSEILGALCFDPDPRVIRAVLDNTRVGLEHGRLIAAHHRTSTGLGHLGRKAAFIRDRQAQRHLFRNPQLSDVLFEKIIQPRRMGDAYQLAVSRDVTERVRSSARKAFRKKFAAGTADEKVSLIFRTEGRCLPMLIGVPLDGRAAALIVRRPIHSTLLIQNLGRWPATPPAVLLHLAKQPTVRRNPALRDMLRRHPNAPSQLK